MAEYKHGTYGEFAGSIGGVSTDTSTVAVCVGVAPVNLVRGFEQYVNAPVKLGSMNDVRRYMGYSDKWDTFDLCEAIHTFLDNAQGNVGPIVAINVLDPATHKKAQATTTTLTFTNGRAIIESDTIILDTLVLSGKVEGVDFNIDYDFTKGQAIITGEGLTGNVQATYSEIDASGITAEDIIGGVTAGGVYTGLGCLELVYQELGLIPNLILCPKYSADEEVYEAMVKAGTKINGHWDAFVYADLPLEDGGTKLDTIDTIVAWKGTSVFVNERSKVFWPQGKDAQDRVRHAAILAAWRTLLIDATHNGIPMESCSNKAVPVVKHYFGEGSTNRGFDQSRANALNAAGITTIVYWGGQWVIWGPHTAAYKYGAVTDNRVIFDNSIRTMMYVTNDFQREWAFDIDTPMTRAKADTIKNREQEKADARAAVGAFIGTPVVRFDQSVNPTGELVEGNFVWDFEGTPTPPWKSGTLRVAYTTAGFDAYFGEVE